MDLRRLRYFRAVAEEGHVTRAAARLGIQQAPLSQQIKVFEKEVGAQLFVRKPRGVELTEAGRALLAETEAIFASLDRALATTRRVARGEEGILRVGFTSSACLHPFPAKAIRAFRGAHPKVEVQFAQDSTPGLLARLGSEQIDAAFTRTTLAAPPDLRMLPLLEESLIVALPKGHGLAKSRARPRILLEHLASEDFIGYPRAAGAGLYDAIIAACVASGFNPRITQEAPQMIAAIHLVAAGLGLAIVPASLERLRCEGVVYRPLSGRPPPRAQLNLAVRKDLGAASAVAAFVRITQQRAASYTE